MLRHSNSFHPYLEVAISKLPVNKFSHNTCVVRVKRYNLTFRLAYHNNHSSL